MTGREPRVAVVGCGYWGRNLVRDFAGLGALEAIVDTDAATAAALQERHGGRVLDFADALADPAIDGIVIAAPAARHYTLARAALEAGKHVYVEKPLALDMAQGRELAALAQVGGRVLMVGHLLRYHPAFVTLQRMVAEGRLGRLRYVYSNRLSFGILRREEDALWSLAPHDLSMILALAGEEPSTVTAFGAPTLHPTIADFAQVQLAFPSGLKGHVFCSWLHPFKEQRLVVVGEQGMLVFEDSAREPARKLRLFAHRVDWIDGIPRAVKAGDEGEPVPYPDANPLQEECRHFLACMRDGTTPRTDSAEGLRVLSVLERASAALSGAPAAAPRPPGVHETAWVDERVRIGDGTRIWHFSHILPDVTIGRKCSIGQNVVIGPKVTVGDNVKIQNNVSVYEGVTLEDHVFCGPSCVFTNVNNPRSEIVRKSEYRPTLVRRGATIGANATIVCGHTLGEYSFIAAGAVVAGDVPAYALMAGVPARRIGWMSRAGARLDASLVCPLTGTAYRETAPDRLEEIPVTPDTGERS